MKQRADITEKKVIEEKVKYNSFREKVQRDVRELIKRTRGDGNLTEDAWGKGVSHEPDGSQLDRDAKYENYVEFL
jgi:hypothetical protein